MVRVNLTVATVFKNFPDLGKSNVRDFEPDGGTNTEPVQSN